ncbi:MAG: NUDIX hydrolase N-terminal domain-containing protein [Anaerolineales bacterium]|jgi:ADP-ribose pyrophosphatase YjhB (NUDIX family)
MDPERGDRWLHWAREIEALAKTGLHYARNKYEEERAERLLEVAAEIIAGYSSLTMEQLDLAFEQQPGYVTPKVDVRGAVFDQDSLLMVREVMDGGWTLPGGWADVGESPSLATEREVLEEAGLEVKATRLVGVYDANRVPGSLDLFHAYKLVFICDLVGGEINTSHETSDAGFFEAGHLPHPLSGYRTTKRHLEDVFRFHHDGSLPAVFD